jgi:hypothetical protein
MPTVMPGLMNLAASAAGMIFFAKSKFKIRVSTTSLEANKALTVV